MKPSLRACPSDSFTGVTRVWCSWMEFTSTHGTWSSIAGVVPIRAKQGCDATSSHHWIRCQKHSQSIALTSGDHVRLISRVVYSVPCWLPHTRTRDNYGTLSKCWFKVGPPSTTVAQHQTRIGSTLAGRPMFSSLQSTMNFSATSTCLIQHANNIQIS